MRISEQGRTATAYTDATLTFSNRRELRRLATDALDRGARTLIVDLSDTEHVDTAAVRTLATLAREIDLRGGACRLANVRPGLVPLLAPLLAPLRLDPVSLAGAPEQRRVG
jgi:anti-anti-sigma regulatory factor